MPVVREFSPGKRCCPGQLERKPRDTSEKLWLEQRSFPLYSTKTPGSHRTGRSLRSSTEAENSTENQGFSMDFQWILLFFLLPWRRGTGRDLQGNPCSHQDTSLIPQKENPSEGQPLPLPPWSCFYWIHLHLQSLGEPSRLEMHTSNRKTEGNPFLTLPAPGLSLQSPISSSTAKTPAWGASQESLIWNPRLQRGFFSNSTLFSDGLDKIQGDGDPRGKEWVFFFWKLCKNLD